MEQIEIKGKLICECLAELQITIIKQKIRQLNFEIEKLQKILKELKSYENKERDFHYYDSIDLLR